MRILYHHRTQLEDAQGIHILEMVSAFRQLGHEVEMAALVSGGNNQAREQQRELWRWIVTSTPNWLYEVAGLGYNLYGFAMLVARVLKSRPHVIYERYALNTFCGVLVGRFFGIPHILEVNAPLLLEHKQLGKLAFKWVAAWSERWICSNSTRTIVVTTAMKEILEQEGVPAGKITVMTNGINPDEFHPTISGEEIRSRYRLDGVLVIGFVGWFRPWHGLDMLLEVMAEAQLAAKGVQLLLVGDGPACADLRRYAEKNKLLSSVIFTGPIARSEIAPHIAVMDVAVQPKVNQYACPMKILEYMAMSRCIVAPNQPNIREILDDGANACLFLPGNRQHFREVLLRVLFDHSLRQDLGKAAYVTLLRCGFLWSENAKRAIRLAFECDSKPIQTPAA
jgi:glycosyltransferase involved in cell wall biosynthesis